MDELHAGSWEGGGAATLIPGLSMDTVNGVQAMSDSKVAEDGILASAQW